MSNNKCHKSESIKKPKVKGNSREFTSKRACWFDSSGSGIDNGIEQGHLRSFSAPRRDNNRQFRRRFRRRSRRRSAGGGRGLLLRRRRHQLLDQGFYGTHVLVGTADAGQEEALEADGFAQIVDLEQQGRTALQIAAFAGAAFRGRATAHGGNLIARMSRRWALQTVARFHLFDGGDFRRLRVRLRRQADVDLVAVFDDVGQRQLAQVEQGATQVPVFPLRFLRDWQCNQIILMASSLAYFYKSMASITISYV